MIQPYNWKDGGLKPPIRWLKLEFPPWEPLRISSVHGCPTVIQQNLQTPQKPDGFPPLGAETCRSPDVVVKQPEGVIVDKI